MKAIPSPLGASLCGLLAFVFLPHASAQTVSDDFSSPTNWSAIWAPSGATGQLSFTNSRLDYSNTGSGAGFALRTLTTFQASSAANWSVQVDVHMANTDTWSAGLGGSAWRDLSLIAYNTPNPPSFSDPFTMFGATAERYQGAPTSNSFYGFARDLAGNQADLPSFTDNQADVTLRLSYDAALQRLTAWYDSNGATGGYSWTQLGVLYIGSSIPEGAIGSNWNMSASGTFSFALIGDSGIQDVSDTLLVGPGEAYFDNLQGTGLTAIPEPSACAASLGLFVLALAAWSRRQPERTQT